MLGGLQARSEMNGLLDELYGGGMYRPVRAERLGGAQDRAEGCRSPCVEVVTRQECGGEERKQVTLLANDREEEDRMPAEERYADRPKKERGLVDKAVDKAREKGYVDESTVRKAREKGFIDKANEAVDKIKARLSRR